MIRTTVELKDQYYDLQDEVKIYYAKSGQSPFLADCIPFMDADIDNTSKADIYELLSVARDNLNQWYGYTIATKKAMFKQGDTLVLIFRVYKYAYVWSSKLNVGKYKIIKPNVVYQTLDYLFSFYTDSGYTLKEYRDLSPFADYYEDSLMLKHSFLALFNTAPTVDKFVVINDKREPIFCYTTKDTISMYDYHTRVYYTKTKDTKRALETEKRRLTNLGYENATKGDLRWINV